jgi:hypothetical protein
VGLGPVKGDTDYYYSIFVNLVPPHRNLRAAILVPVHKLLLLLRHPCNILRSRSERASTATAEKNAGGKEREGRRGCITRRLRHESSVVLHGG